MPTYEYRCSKCGDFEFRQGMNDPVLAACPDCGGPVQRLIGRNVLVLYRGSGFHNTDYRSPEYLARAKAEEKPSPDASGETGAKPGGNACGKNAAGE